MKYYAKMNFFNYQLVKIILFSIFIFAGCSNSSLPVSHSTNLEYSDTHEMLNFNNAESLTEESCELPDLYANLDSTPLAEYKNPVHLGNHAHALPFPSDVFAYRDTSSPTGVRLKILNDILPPVFKEKAPEFFSPETIFTEPDGSDADGFSAGTPVIFEFESEIDPYWLGAETECRARNGGDTFLLLDLTTGDFIPAIAINSIYARDERRDHPGHVIQVMPRSRFEYGRRYMAIVTDKLKRKDGSDFTCSKGFEKAKSQNVSDISNFYEPYLRFLECNKGINRNEILSATIFTIRSRESSVGPTLDMMSTVLNDDFTDEDVKIEMSFNWPSPYV